MDVFTKHAWVKRLKYKKAKTVLHGFVEIVNGSKIKPNKKWVDQGREVYNSPMQKQLDHNDILMDSTHNENNSLGAERFIRNLKGKSYEKNDNY